MSAFELYIVGQCMVASLLVLWFLPRSKIHVFVILRHLGWRKGMWSVPMAEMRFWTREDCDLWAAVNLPPTVSELLDCPYCLSAHFSFWASVFLVLAAGAPWWFTVAGTFGWSALANIALLKLKAHEH